METANMSVIELRQYTLKPRQRDVLIGLFEREFIESQEDLGMTLYGTFRDADDPDRFVWLRGFADMKSRAASLAAFYSGPVWKDHREAANATIVDSDNVLLLRPAWNGSGIERDETRAPHHAAEPASGFVVAAICHFDTPASDAFVTAFRDIALSRCEAARGKIVAALVTEPGANTFPALPVREDENVFVWFTLFADVESGRRGARAEILPRELRAQLAKPVECLRLLPTSRSRLHG